MARHYLDFVGLNTFIYEFVGWDGDGTEVKQLELGDGTRHYALNTFGILDDDLDPRPLSEYKNYRFADTHNVHLANTASFFPALMLKRNGPYGFPMWKQTRIGQNPLTRRQVKNNILTMVEQPGPEVVFRRGENIRTVRGKYGPIIKYDEVPVASRHKPFIVVGQVITDEGELEKFQLKASYGNETVFFENDIIDRKLGLSLDKSRQYEAVSGFYLNGGLDNDGSPIDVFESMTYHETVWPPRVYTHKNYVRQRTTFTFPWRDLRIDRREETDNGFGSGVTQSVWSMDGYTVWDTKAVDTGFLTDGRYNNLYGYDVNSGDDTDYGILQNQYCFASFALPVSIGLGTTDQYLRVGPQYNRKHTLLPSSSVVSPNGMKMEGINYGTTFGDIDKDHHSPGGEAKWEAGAQSGLNPFYDSYDNFIQGVKQYGKDYSIIPEFRISEHVEEYQSKGLTEEISSLFSLTGGLENTADSSKQNFYKIYSTSDFMKHFEMVKEDHKEFVPANSITLRCKAIKKFLPYEGFYPAQRSVELAKQFYSSYKDFTSVSASGNTYGHPTDNLHLFQNLMVPTFAPGIFFNSIKAGVACDYPLINSNVSIANNYVIQNGDDYYLRNPSSGAGGLWDRRVPFEAIVEPEKHLAGMQIYCNEPHRFANNSGSVMWDGNGDSYYKLMAQNFIAETSEFFLKGKNFTSIVSQPSNNPTVGNAEAGKTYMMRIKMYKSKDTSSIPKVSGSSGLFEVPQYPSSSKETFTMYSRPSAFGPPQGADLGGLVAYLGEDGENYSFTPPYYYGQAFCDVTFTAAESKKYSISEIINSSSIRQWRYMDTEDTLALAKTLMINGLGSTPSNSSQEFGMHLDSSVNVFSQIIDEENSVDPNNPATRWAIQTKFETPMLNFNHLSASTSITLPNNASQSVPRGMWHQYGLIEEDPAKGVFLQVDSVPSDWIDNLLNENSSATGSLVDLCGFSTEAVKLGQIADEKKVYEAVVAVPFIEEEGERKFFRIPRKDIENAQEPSKENLTGQSIKTMLEKMKRYVMPPPMDFVNNTSIDPFAMYIFEFSHTFKKQDLADMWQNLYPEIGQTFETQTSTLSHELLAHELLGGGAKMTPEGLLDVNAVGNEIPERVRWMVFKVKQRAKINYYEKIIGRNDDLSEATVTSQGASVQVSYNWPYDFFSLVELAKLESEVKFAKRREKPDQEPRENIEPVTSQKIRIDTASRNLIAEGKVSTSPGIEQPISEEQSRIKRIISSGRQQ